MYTKPTNRIFAYICRCIEDTLDELSSRGWLSWEDI